MGSFLVAVRKRPDRSNSRRQGWLVLGHSASPQPVTARKPQRQVLQPSRGFFLWLETKSDADIEQWSALHPPTQLTAPTWVPHREGGHPQLKRVFPYQSTTPDPRFSEAGLIRQPYRQTHRCAQSFTSQVLRLIPIITAPNRPFLP